MLHSGEVVIYAGQEWVVGEVTECRANLIPLTKEGGHRPVSVSPNSELKVKTQKQNKKRTI